jgi:multidrug efflux pump subunit AcrA (membrane-fusion protein)
MKIQATREKLLKVPALQKAKTYVLAHKKLSVIALVLVGVGAYFLFKSDAVAEVKYVTTTVTKETIVSSITGSGQIEASNQIDLKARGSGEITYVGIKPGDVVKKGKTLFSLDARDAAKAVRNAETDLETAKLELEKFQKAPDSVDVLAIKNAIADAETSKTDADKAIKDAYKNLLNSSLTAVSDDSSSTQTPPTISGSYTKGIEAKIIITVRSTGDGGYFSTSSVPSGIVSGTGTISSTIPQPIGDSGLYIKFANTQTNQQTWNINLPNKAASNYDSNYTAYQNALDNKEKVVKNADLTIAQNNKKMDELYRPDELELRSKQLVIRQKQDALTDARADLSDYYITAPFDGTIASVAGKLGDTASGTLGTIITKQKIAKISLNEVDVAKIKLAQKATLTFDAIEDFTLTGEVAEIDTIGTVSQGVVSYNVKIAFDTQDDRVKPGMSVTGAIITDVKQDVLSVPNSAIKTKNGSIYVETFAQALPTTDTQGSLSPVPPKQQNVEVGISNDTTTEIVSGVAEGTIVVSRTITTSAAKTATTSAPSLLGGNATRGITGGATRAAGGR